MLIGERGYLAREPGEHDDSGVDDWSLLA